MDENTNKTVVDGENNLPIGEVKQEAAKTFTQDDLNRIISERLNREKTKLEADVVKREQELQHKEFVFSAKETLTSRGLSFELLDALNTSSQESFDRSLSI